MEMILNEEGEKTPGEIRPADGSNLGSICLRPRQIDRKQADSAAWRRGYFLFA